MKTLVIEKRIFQGGGIFGLLNGVQNGTAAETYVDYTKKVLCSSSTDAGAQPVSDFIFSANDITEASSQQDAVCRRQDVSGGRFLAEWVKGDFDKASHIAACPTSILYWSASYTLTIK